MTGAPPRIPRQHTINRIARDVFDAMRWRGESTLIFHLYRAGEGDVNRCPVCYDTVYKQADTSKDCAVCYGTGYEGGFQWAARTYAMFSTANQDERITNRGEWNPEDRTITVPAIIPIRQNDIAIRATNWDGLIPYEGVRAYKIGSVKPQNVRDGITGPDQVTTMAFQGSATLLPDDDPWVRFIGNLRENRVERGRIVKVDSIEHFLVNDRHIDGLGS